MTIRSKGPFTSLSWLTRGISVGYRHPKPLLGGAALLLVAVLLPSLITLPLQFQTASAGTPLSPANFVVCAKSAGGFIPTRLVASIHAFLGRMKRYG